jgi:hypothetical protein
VNILLVNHFITTPRRTKAATPASVCFLKSQTPIQPRFHLLIPSHHHTTTLLITTAAQLSHICKKLNRLETHFTTPEFDFYYRTRGFQS